MQNVLGYDSAIFFFMLSAVLVLYSLKDIEKSENKELIDFYFKNMHWTKLKMLNGHCYRIQMEQYFCLSH